MGGPKGSFGRNHNNRVEGLMQRLVVCCDGTWNKPDETDRGVPSPTNVWKIDRALAPAGADGVPQARYYDEGVGTGPWYDRWLGGAFGVGLSQNILQAYTWLVEKYEDGDELFFFGFSRGAYTVRSLAGLIRNSGLLRREHADRRDEAYDLYRRRDPASGPNGADAQAFRAQYSREIRIRFIGVWDTVGALGIPFGPMRVFTWPRYQFHDVKLSSYVDFAYQALAIDERRRPFKPSIWEQQEHATGQVMEQRWFAGVHSNVGGGYADAGLSDLAFDWMRSKAEACGLAFDAAYLRKAIAPDELGELRVSNGGWYRLLPGYGRPLCAQANGNEDVAPPALDRNEELPDYRPENLMRWLKAGTAPKVAPG
jgi:uncharacterized protein (DUF2235 family)